LSLPAFTADLHPADDEGVELRIVVGSPRPVPRTPQLSGLDRILAVYDSVAVAVR
jgi:hypothetical protein